MALSPKAAKSLIDVKMPNNLPVLSVERDGDDVMASGRGSLYSSPSL
jgi:hypothetical protein